MNDVIKFFTRRQGRKQASLTDWISYGFLFLGFLIIFLPVLWLVMNSVKSQFLLQKYDTNFLPMDYERIARATIYGPDGKNILIMKDLDPWVMFWKNLDDDERAEKDVINYIKNFSGNEYYALRSHFGLVSVLAKELIVDQDLPDWLIKYPSMFPSAKKEYDPQSIVDNLNQEDARLLSEFLGLKPYKPNGFTAQILISMADPQSGEIVEYSVSRINPTKDTVNARLVSNPEGGIAKLPQNEIIINKSLKP